jgi:hypothetical protein
LDDKSTSCDHRQHLLLAKWTAELDPSTNFAVSSKMETENASLPRLSVGNDLALVRLVRPDARPPDVQEHPSEESRREASAGT